MPLRPLFLLSVPRSGSTLVQRVLAAHPGVATASEPWILLPQLYALREHGVRAEYWHQTAVQAVADFCEELPRGRDDYLAAVHRLALELYARAGGSEQAAYFLDKTPRYHFIADELLPLFPDGRFVFLWRNPLSVVTSTLETFRAGRWEPGHFTADTVDGFCRLVDAWKEHQDRSCAVRYEDLVSGREQPWRAIFDYLELPFDSGVLSSFSGVRLRGRYGDPTGMRHYQGISTDPVAKWTAAVGSPVRKAWCRRYLQRLGRSRLEAMGYDLERLLEELERAPGRARGAGPDVLRMGVSAMQRELRRAALRLPEGPQPVGPGFAAPPPLVTRAWRAVRRRRKSVVFGRS